MSGILVLGAGTGEETLLSGMWHEQGALYFKVADATLQHQQTATSGARYWLLASAYAAMRMSDVCSLNLNRNWLDT